MKILLLVLLFIGIFPFIAVAQNVVSESAQRALTSQTNPLKEMQAPPTQLPQQPEVEKKEKKKTVISGGPKFLVRKVVLRGHILFPSEKLLLAALDAYKLEGQMLTFQDLQDFADHVTAYYQRHGYVNSYAYLPVQKVLDGIVTIDILEVRVGNVTVTGNRWFSERLFRNALKLNTGDFFKIEDLENAMSQINAQPDRMVRAYLQPGEITGTTDVMMKVEDRFPIHASFEYNLRGNDLTGHSRYVMHLTDNNLTGRGDILQSSLALAEQGALYAEALHYELPVAGTSDVFHVDFSDALSKLQKEMLTYDVKGKSINFIPGYTHNFIQTAMMKLDGDIRFELKDSKTDVEKNKFSFDRTRALVGGPRIMLNDQGGRTTGGVDVHVGIPDFLGSSSVHDPLSSRPDSGGGFVYETLNAVRIQKLPLGMSFIGQVNGQYSPVPLTSLEQMSLGGMYSVRGYSESDSSGDSGFSLSEELRIPLYFIPEDWYVWGMRDETWRNTLSFAAFIDEGRVFDYKREQENSAKDRTLLGAGPGIRFYVSPDLNMEFDLGFPFGDTPSDKREVHPHLSVRIGF